MASKRIYFDRIVIIWGINEMLLSIVDV